MNKQPAETVPSPYTQNVPTPWGFAYDDQAQIVDAYGRTVTLVRSSARLGESFQVHDQRDESIAGRIVSCVNSHERLKEDVQCLAFDRDQWRAKAERLEAELARLRTERDELYTDWQQMRNARS